MIDSVLAKVFRHRPHHRIARAIATFLHCVVLFLKIGCPTAVGQAGFEACFFVRVRFEAMSLILPELPVLGKSFIPRTAALAFVSEKEQVSACSALALAEPIIST